MQWRERLPEGLLLLPVLQRLWSTLGAAHVLCVLSCGPRSLRMTNRKAYRNEPPQSIRDDVRLEFSLRPVGACRFCSPCACCLT